MTKRADHTGKWQPIPCSPVVLTTLLAKLGVDGVRVEELYNFDEESLSRPIFGLLFMSSFCKKAKLHSSIKLSSCLDIYFASLVTDESCCALALLSIVLNCLGLSIGNLAHLKTFSKDFPPELKGLAIVNTRWIRDIQNALSKSINMRDPSFLAPNAGRVLKKIMFPTRYVAYIEVDGKTCELDCDRAGPVMLEKEACTGSGDQSRAKEGESQWLEPAVKAIQLRIQQHQDLDLPFTVLAVVDARNEAQGPIRKSLGNQDVFLLMRRKHHEWMVEQRRRKHVYTPFILNFLRILREKKRLEALLAKNRRIQEITEPTAS